MVTQYIKNFKQDDLASIALLLHDSAKEQEMLWHGTVYIGSKPLYIKCFVKWMAEKIEKFFVKTVPNVHLDNAPTLYVLATKIDDILPHYDKNINTVYFTGDNIYTKPDMVIHDLNIFVRDNQTFYIAVDSDNNKGFYYLGENHLLMKLFNYIFDAQTNMVLHGAVVGYKDYGILITGLSGSGKSTLSAYCATLGMDFIGDDRVALRFDCKDVIAEPIYSTVSLIEPIDDLKVKESVKSLHGNKDVLILDKSQIAEQTKIQAVIEPRFANQDLPSIEKYPHTPILTRICADYSKFGSMTRSMTVVQDYHDIFDLLKNARFFRINLSKSIYENAKAILNLAKNKGVINV